MSSRRAGFVAIFCPAFVFASSSLFAQATGSLSGTVQDRSGAVVPGAAVTATSQGTNFSRGTTTDDTGHYSIAGLAPGHYSVQVHSTGFAPLVKSGLVLSGGYETEADAQLSIKASRQAITVTE